VTQIRISTVANLFVAALAIVVALAFGAAPALAAPVNAGHLQAELVADHVSISPGGTVHLALRQAIQPDWHTYWRNPGDSGQATTLAWTLPAGWRAGDIVWPTPARLKIGPLMDYGYEGEVLLPVTLTAPATAQAGQTVSLKADAEFLVCKDICVPESANVTLDLPVTAAPGAADPKWSGPIATALAAAPMPGALTAAMSATANAVKISITGAAIRGGNFPDAYFYPYDPSVIDHAQPQVIDRGPEGLTLSLAPGSAFKSGKPPAVLAGVLTVAGKAYEVSAPPGPALAGSSGLGAPAAAAGGPAKLALAIVFAFLGGLILNLMPCVFPVLSMKAASLASHAHRPREARIQGLAFMAGVVVTFLALAGVLIAARAAGQAVGWGFQLQSAAVVAGLALVMLLVALNLSGLFEVGASLQSAAGELGGAERGGVMGAAFTGALAVAVAAPCTAPFMAGAIGFALTQGPIVALSIFLALALGLAAPFTALAFAPGLLSRLPRPGAWMEGFRKVLAFPMYATAAWLVWVFSQQAGTLALGGLLAGAVLTGLAAWLYGVAQRRRMIGAPALPTYALAAVVLALAFAAGLWPEPGAPSGQASAATSTEGLPSEPFSPARLAALQAQGKPVFVNFTAAWCVTCQVNDKVALSGADVADAFRKAGVVYLVGDWTNRDAVIAHTLADHGRAGVPLYLMYPAKGGEPAVLPQILTEPMVVDAVKAAVKS
jgi:thiol:disulfide interchange protein